MMEKINFSFRGIQNMCRTYYRDILERKDIRRFLLSRRVRFINPMGKFDYAYFGDYYFNGDVMMLITKDIKYVAYHKPDQLSHTLWSTVPVIFAGVDTRMKDDKGREIFTGDVVTYEHYTSVVRYFGNADIPGLIGDNCDIPFDGNGTLHKDGTAFVDVNPIMFKEYDPLFVRWAANGFCQGGPSFEEIREKASLGINAPTFIEVYPKKKRTHHLGYDDIEEVLTDEMTLAYLRDCEVYEDEDGEPTYTIFADNLPDYHHERWHEIPIPDKADFVEDLKNAIKEFLLYAHNHPNETFVLADFKGTFHICNAMELKVAMAFDDWFNYKIYNVIMPRWIFFRLGAWHGIGED
jgi:hypothetical protein